MRIVIADDDRITRNLLRALLVATDHEVYEAVDGDTAWELIEAVSPHLLITDWIMPGLDGPGLIERLRNANRPAYIYIIILTSRDSKADLVRGLNMGADDYVTKPFDPDELRSRVAIGKRIVTLEANLRAARDRFAYLATYDQLTGLFTRLAISDHVGAEFERAARHGQRLSLALLDIDHFKTINDQYGHLTGDAALRHVARLIGQSLRPYDWAGRWGGEEFLVVLASTSLNDAVAVSDRLRALIAATPLILADGREIRLTVSVGIACAVPGANSISEPAILFQRADAALYAAKGAGRNRICRADELLFH